MSARQTIHMKYHTLFSMKGYERNRMSPATILLSNLRVKYHLNVFLPDLDHSVYSVRKTY